jgi:hypothetical protein
VRQVSSAHGVGRHRGVERQSAAGAGVCGLLLSAAERETSRAISKCTADVVPTSRAGESSYKGCPSYERHCADTYRQLACVFVNRQQWRQSEAEEGNRHHDRVRPEHVTLKAIPDRFSHLLRPGFVETDATVRARVPNFRRPTCIHRPPSKLGDPLLAEVRSTARTLQSVPDQQESHYRHNHSAGNTQALFLPLGERSMEERHSYNPCNCDWDEGTQIERSVSFQLVSDGQRLAGNREWSWWQRGNGPHVDQPKRDDHCPNNQILQRPRDEDRGEHAPNRQARPGNYPGVASNEVAGRVAHRFPSYAPAQGAA